MPPPPPEDVFISVDVETAGPHPGRYSLLSIGACLVSDPDLSFYVELQPVNDSATPEALAVTGLSLVELAERGLPPAEAMASFEAWVKTLTPHNRRPVFVAFNAPFDWMFVNDYFHRFLGRNPFGYSALDMKALYMGLTGARWSETSISNEEYVFFAQVFLPGLGRSYTDAPYRWWFTRISPSYVGVNTSVESPPSH